MKVAAGQGLASWGSVMKKQLRGHMVSRDNGLIPQGHKFCHRYSCGERHPGLCFTKDAAIYKSSLALARNLETRCCDDIRGKFVLVWSDCESVSIPLYFAERRARRAFAPQAVVLCHCDVLPSSESDDGWHRVWFAETSAFQFDFVSVWSVAKQFISVGVAQVNFTVGVRRWVKDPANDLLSSSVLLVKWSGATSKIWPGIFRWEAEKDPPELSALLKKDPPSQAKRPPAASVQAFVGTGPQRKKFPAPKLGDDGADHLFSDFDSEYSGSENEDRAGPEEDPAPLPPALLPVRGDGGLARSVGDPEPLAAGGAAAGSAGPPPLPPPPAPPPPGGPVYGSRVGAGYRVLPVPGGALHWSAHLKQLNAHCTPHRVGSVRCKMDSTILLDGRPRKIVGALMAWLSCPCDTKADHDRLKGEVVKLPYLTERRSGRELLVAMAGQDTPEGALAKEILEEDGGVDCVEPDTAR